MSSDSISESDKEKKDKERATKPKKSSKSSNKVASPAKKKSGLSSASQRGVSSASRPGPSSASRSGPPGGSDDDTQMLSDVDYPADGDAPATVVIPGRRDRRREQHKRKQNKPIEQFRAKDLAGRVEAIWTDLDVGAHGKDFRQAHDEMRNRWRHVYAYLSALPGVNIDEFLAELQ